MTGKTESIEVDPATAAALKTRAAERGVSVSELVAELVPMAPDDEAVAELDRRWAAAKAGRKTIPQADIEAWLRTWGTPEFRPRFER
jgi:predicted transcriptional regulator